MISSEALQQKQEDKDFRREQNVKELKRRWKTYNPSQQVKFTREFSEIAEMILTLIRGVK